MRSRVLVIFFVLVTLGQAYAWEVFVNNKPFKGEVAGGPTSLMLQAEPLLKMVNLDLQIADGAVSFDGQPVPSETKDGVLFVNAKSLAEICGGKYTVSNELQSIDIYLLAARKEAKPGPGSNTYLSVSGPGSQSTNLYSAKFSFIQDAGRGRVSVVIKGSEGEEWVLAFEAGGQATLRPGVYHAIESRGNMNPSMLVKSNGKSYGGWGTFEVLDFAAGRVPSRLAIDFIVHPEGKPDQPTLTGKVRYQTALP